MVIAKKHGLDLVEVAANAKPPVCRILEFGKYKYELSKNKKNKDKSGGKLSRRPSSDRVSRLTTTRQSCAGREISSPRLQTQAHHDVSWT